MAGEKTYLYVHQMDEVDLKLYRDRLERAWKIVDEATDIQRGKTKMDETHYRLQVGDDRHLIAHVSLIRDRIGRPYFRLWTDHTDGTSNFTITNPIRLGEKEINPAKPDEVLDHLELLLNEAQLAFSNFGRIGAKHQAEVEKMDAQAFKMINALIHAYMEFEDGRRFHLQIRSLRPYGKPEFHEQIDGNLHNFLSEKTAARLDWFLPWVSKLEYRRAEGMSYYDIGPLDAQDIVITAEDMPKPEEIKAILQPITDIPGPHVVDTGPPIRVYLW